MADLSTTLSALAAPRRCLPIVAVVAALIAVELYYGDARSALVPASMSLAFLLLAPWSWRVLLAKRTTFTGATLFAAEAVLVVLVLGVGLPRVLGLGPTFLTDLGSLVIAGVLYVVGGWGLGRDIELEYDLEHVRLKAIRAHLDPHFLYNTLNAIAEWCAEDPKVAEEATIRLADILRATLEGLELRTWPLSRELALVDDLLELHRLRDAEAFTPSIDADPSVVAVEVPPLALVAMIENAVKHGPRAGHRGSITVRVTATDDKIRCEIENPGTFAPSRDKPGRGLATLRKRLALAYGDRAHFSIAAAGADRTRAVLELERGRS
jgi:hypothetical protein